MSLYNSWRVGDILKWLCINVKYHKMMCRAPWQRSFIGHGDILRSYTLSCQLYIFWTPGRIYKKLSTCQVWWVNVQCVCLTKVGSRSRSLFKVKHYMTVLHVHSITLIGLVRSTIRWCKERMFDQGLFKVNVIAQGQTYSDQISSPICIS